MAERAAIMALGAFAIGAAVGCAVAGGAQQPEAGSFVTGIGGVFFKVADPEATRAWYGEHLGIDAAAGSGANFLWREHDEPDRVGFTVWSAFPADTDYFGPGDQELMINYRVRDLDALLAKLAAEGVEQAGGVDEYSYGRFAWIVDGDGNRVELWEPIDEASEE